jgi:YfiR/HmsC-like
MMGCRAAVLLVCVLLVFGPVWSGCAADVPADIQLAVYVKILKMDRNFKPRTPTVVAVLYQQTLAPSAALERAIVRWAGDGGTVRVVSIALDAAEVEQALGSVSADVFYVAPLRGVDIRQIAKIAQRRQIRTVTGVPGYARDGIGVAIGVRNDHPLIMINVEASRAEGAAFQAQLLRMAELVKGN